MVDWFGEDDAAAEGRGRRALKRVSVYDYGDYYWIFVTDGLSSAVDLAETSVEAAAIVQRRLVSPLNPLKEYLEEN